MEKQRDKLKLRRWCIRRIIDGWSISMVGDHAQTPERTVYAWWNRFQWNGWAGLLDASRRPPHNPQAKSQHSRESPRGQKNPRLVQRSHRSLPEGSRHPDQPRKHLQHPKNTPTHRQTLRVTQPEKPQTLATKAPRQPLADRRIEREEPTLEVQRTITIQLRTLEYSGKRWKAIPWAART